MTSLAELRMIEEQRIVAERNERAADEAARVAAQQAAEQAAREAEVARIAEERAAALALEKARAEAEREARMRVELAEAAERQRQQAALEERRLAEELQLEREAVARTRPTWMLAVTGLAIVSVIALAAFALDRMTRSAAAEEKARIARMEKEQYKAEMRAQAEQLALLETEAGKLDADLARAMEAVRQAQNAADLKARNAELQRIADQKRENDRKRAIIRKKKWDEGRVLRLDPACVKDPIGCLDKKQ